LNNQGYAGENSADQWILLQKTVVKLRKKALIHREKRAFTDLMPD
jgi:hypothetical protein